MCRREGIAENLYYRTARISLAESKKRLLAVNRAISCGRCPALDKVAAQDGNDVAKPGNEPDPMEGLTCCAGYGIKRWSVLGRRARRDPLLAGSGASGRFRCRVLVQKVADSADNPLRVESKPDSKET